MLAVVDNAARLVSVRGELEDVWVTSEVVCVEYPDGNDVGVASDINNAVVPETEECVPRVVEGTEYPSPSELTALAKPEDILEVNVDMILKVPETEPENIVLGTISVLEIVTWLCIETITELLEWLGTGLSVSVGT
jgi:hypothetical protein